MKEKRLPVGSIVLVGFAFTLGWLFKPVPDLPGPLPLPGEAAPRQAAASSLPAAAKPSSRSTLKLPSLEREHSSFDRASVFPAGESGYRQPLTSDDIVERGQLFRTEADPIKRRQAYLQLLGGMTRENAAEIRKQIAHLPPNSPEFIDFHYAYGQLGGAEAVLSGIDTVEPDMLATFAGWASADPEAAREWFEELEQKGERGKWDNQDYLRWGLVKGLADIDSQLGVDFAYERAEAGDNGAGRMLAMVADKVIKSQGPAAAASWAGDLPEGELRSSAMTKVAWNYAATDPEGAAAWATEYNQQPGGNKLIDVVGGTWARRDPEAAIDWLGSLDPSDGRSAGLDSAFSSWARRDAVAAGDFINEMPVSSDRDSAIGGYATSIVSKAPGMAYQWIESIEDPAARERLFIRTSEILFHQNPGAVGDYLASGGLSPEQGQKLLESFRHGDERK